MRGRPRILDPRKSPLTAFNKREASLTPPIVDPRDLVSRQPIFRLVAPGKENKGREGARQPDSDHPPHVPNQRETGHDSEKRHHKSRRTVARHVDWFVVRRVREAVLLEGLLLDAPIGFFPGNVWHDRKVKRRRRRTDTPFESAAIPGIAGPVAQRLPIADGHDELRDLKPDASKYQRGATRRND